MHLCLFCLLSNSVVNVVKLIVIYLLVAKCKSIHLQGEQICCIGFSYLLTHLLSLAKVIQYYSVTIIAVQWLAMLAYYCLHFHYLAGVFLFVSRSWVS